jgi:SAM-dependent methyltransferase
MPREFECDETDLESMVYAQRYHRYIVHLFEKYLGKRIVDVGSGDGTITRMLLELHPEKVWSVEPTDEIFEVLEKTDLAEVKNVELLHGYLSDFAGKLKDQHVSGFIYVNVMEHIEHDEEEMRQAFELLEPGGHLCIFVPALPRLYSDIDKGVGHFRRYTKPELIRKARAAGFEVEKARYFDILGVLPWWIRYTLLKGKGVSTTAVKLYDRVGVPIIKATEHGFWPPIGKNVMLVAKKPDTKE